MINLEWLRTFRTVFITKSLSQASEILMVSQPTVSQHIAALESRMGKRLFERKSKGVEETDMGRILNTMVSGALDQLETVEQKIIQRDSNIKNILSLGISPHGYKTVLCNTLSSMGEYVHIKFGKKDELLTQVERGDLHYAVVHEEADRFDVDCYPLQAQTVVLVATPDMDLDLLENSYRRDKSEAEDWLKEQRWFSHDHNSSLIKLYWLKHFDKKRPAVVPNFVIPNEFEVLYQQSNSSGLSIAFNNVTHHFVNQGLLKTLELEKINYRQLYLVANRKKTTSSETEKILKILRKTTV